MGRGKLSMKLISNEKSRKTTFYKRKTSLLRKAYELSTLCDVRVCVFVYGPNQNDQSEPLQVHTWPSCRNHINDMIASYKANWLHKRPHKTSGLLDFFSERKKKLETDVSKLRKDVAEARFPKWDDRLDHLLEDQLRVLLVELDLKLEMTKKRIEMVMGENVEEYWTSGESSQTLNENMKKTEQAIMSFDQEKSYGRTMFGSSSMDQQTQTIMPVHQQQLPTMGQNFQMDHEIENLSQFLYGANGSLTQINNCFQNYPNFYNNDPTNYGVFMDNNYGLIPQLATQSVLPLSYMPMQFIDDQMMMASNSQMILLNNSSTQVNDQFDVNFNNYEYFIKPNNNL